MEKLYWEPIDRNIESFKLSDEPELIHVIQTGFNDKYMVVYEDAYEINLGKVIFGTKKEIENKFNINL
jgi:hypothetical protein